MARKYHYLDITCPRLRSIEEPFDIIVKTAQAFDGSSAMSDNLICVGRRSPVSQKRAVECMATYFRREFGYDFVQYSADERTNDETTLAWLWADGLSGDYSIVGGCCFRWRDWDDLPSEWGLQWIWLHPYFRRKGMLTRSWGVFTAMFGPFDAEPPLSEAMSCFLKDKPCEHRISRDYPVPFYIRAPEQTPPTSPATATPGSCGP